LGVVGVQLDGPAGVLQGVDLAAQALVGQAGQVIPAGVALPLGVQDAACLGVAPVDDEIAGGLHLGGVGARGAGPLLAVPAVVEAPEPAKAEGVEAVKAAVIAALAVPALLVALLAVPAIALLAVAAGAGLGPGVPLHDGVVGRLHFLEVLLGGRVVGVQVRVPALAFGAVSLFDLFLAGTPLDAQDLIGISHSNVSSQLSMLAGMCPRSLTNRNYSSLSGRKKQAPAPVSGLPGLFFSVFYMVFQPDAGIEDVFQQVGVLHAGQPPESRRRLRQQQLKDLPHLGLVVGRGRKAPEGVVGSPALVPLQIVPGVQQVDVFAYGRAAGPQLAGPAVLLVVEQLGHQPAEAARHQIQILAAGGLVFRQLGQPPGDGLAGAGPAGFRRLAVLVQQFHVAQAQGAAVVLPFVLGAVVVQGQPDVGTVIGGAAVPPVDGADGVDRTPPVPGDGGGLALVQAAQQQVQKSQVVAEGQPPGHAIQHRRPAAQPAVGGAVPPAGFRGHGLLVGDDVAE